MLLSNFSFEILYYPPQWSSIIITLLLFPIASLQIKNSSQVLQISNNFHKILQRAAKQLSNIRTIEMSYLAFSRFTRYVAISSPI